MTEKQKELSGVVEGTQELAKAGNMPFFLLFHLISVIGLNLGGKWYTEISEAIDNKDWTSEMWSHPPDFLSQNPGVTSGRSCNERQSMHCISIIHTFQLAVKLANIQ